MNPIAGFAEIQDGRHARGEETLVWFLAVLVHVTDQILLIMWWKIDFRTPLVDPDTRRP